MYLIASATFFANKNTLINVIGLSLLAYHVSCHECYVCGDGDNMHNCNDFHISTSHLFKEICSTGITSCLTKLIAGNLVLERSCGEKYKIMDCITADGIKYCYCATNLCNGEAVPMTIPGVTDDEDFTEEGSGAVTTVTYTRHIPPTVKPTSSTSSIIHSRLSLLLHLLLLI